MFEHPLPVQVVLQEGEAGTGFCLRLAAKNGLSLVELRSLLEMSATDSFKLDHVRKLALLSGVGPEQLEQRLPAPWKGVRKGLRYAGHALRLRAFHRGRKPQICPVCIGRHGICREEWDFTLSCVCMEHRCPLVDRCPTCDAVLRWDRPATDWSQCRHHLGQAFQAGPPLDPGLIDMQAVLLALMRHDELPQLSFAWPFPGRVSLDGWFALVWAFGSITTSHQAPRPGTFSSVPSSAAVREVILRAHERMWRFSNRDRQQSEELKALIAEAPLVGLLRDSDHEIDRLTAADVYRFIAGESAVDSLLRRYGVSTQLSLFG